MQQIPDPARPSRRHPGVMPGANFAGGRLAPGLRIASHNTDGIRDRPRLSHLNRFPGLSKMHALMKTWLPVNAHIICMQETHLHTSDILTHELLETHFQSAPDEWGLPKFTPFWGSNTEASSAGVAILIRSSLLENVSRRIVVMGVSWASPCPHLCVQSYFLHIHYRPLTGTFNYHILSCHGGWCGRR